jgi:hypothetical protein
MKKTHQDAQIQELKRRGFEVITLPELNRAEDGVLYVFTIPLDALTVGTVEAHPLVINEAVCCDCGGQVELYNIPNAAWNGLGFRAAQFACLGCVAKRLNPSNPPDSLEQIAQQIDKRFPSAGYGLHFMVLANAELGRKYKAGMELQAKFNDEAFTVSIAEGE